jgi:BNR repeat-like domain
MSGPVAPRVMTRAPRCLLALVAAFAMASATTAFASGEDIVKISEDPFTNPQSQHRTEVEPDTFSFGRSVVSAFQVGRIFDGGASDIGVSTSRDGGEHWVRGFLPGVTVFTKPAGTYDRASDASVAYDLRHGVWVISYLAIRNTPSGFTFPVDVLSSRSRDGVHWELPVAVAAINEFLDKNWTVCDNSPRSRFFGDCYTEFDSPSRRDLELMSTSTDGARTWGPARTTADQVHGIGGQPLVQPNGRVVVPFESVGSTPPSQKAFTSDDGGDTWNASVVISTRSSHRVAGGTLRTSALPTAEIDRDGRIFVAWQDSRFEAGSAANDIVYSTSLDGTTWSPVQRIPIDPVGSNVDHFIPGLGVDRGSSGRSTRLALAYYFFPNATCTFATCRLEVGFISSANGGRTWSEPQRLAGPMQLSSLARTSQGVMTGDYISTSFLAGGRTAVPTFAVGLPADGATGQLHEPMYAAQREVEGGEVPQMDDPVLFTGTGVDGNGLDDNDDSVGNGASKLPAPPTRF